MKHLTRRNKTLLIAAGLALGLALSIPPLNGQEDDKVWGAFTAWIRTNPETATLSAYGEQLSLEGVSKTEIERRLEIIRRMFREDPLRGVEITYDRIFSKPLSGDPEQDGFTSTPSVFLMESAEMLKPGRALDVGAGQGRNAVWLAGKGWDVTAIDISEGGLAAAKANAGKTGVHIATVKTSYQEFDFGTEQWDLIVMILSWAPMSDPDFVTRMEAGLRPGGVIIFEHVLETSKQKFPDYVHGLPTNALLGYLQDFVIQYYEEGVWQGDWGGPPAELVRLIARKK